MNEIIRMPYLLTWYQNEKRQQIEYHDEEIVLAMCHPFVLLPGDEHALLVRWRVN